jgi:hypothetical protein
MTVAVQQPQRRESDLDQIAKALGIAQTIYGIGRDISQRDFQQAKAEEESRLRALQTQAAEQKVAAGRREQALQTGIEAGEVTPGQQRVLETRGFKFVTPGQEGAIGVGILPPEGQEGPAQQMAFLTPGEVKRQQDLAAQAKRDAQMLAGIEQERAKSRTKQEKTLRSEWLKQSEPSSEAIDGYNKVLASASNPTPTGATDMALLFGFMKSIDPGSVVRESEFKAAKETQPIPERIANLRDQLFKGTQLHPNQRAAILEESKRAVQARLQEQQKIDQEYRRLAERSDADPEDVVSSRFSDLLLSLGPLHVAGDDDFTAGQVPAIQPGQAIGGTASGAEVDAFLGPQTP